MIGQTNQNIKYQLEVGIGRGSVQMTHFPSGFEWCAMCETNVSKLITGVTSEC